MLLSFYLRAYWGVRAASVDECAERLAALMEQFARIDPLLTGWREGANSKREAIEQPLFAAKFEFEFSQGSHDGRHSPSRWSGGVDAFTQGAQQDSAAERSSQSMALTTTMPPARA